MKDEKKTVAAKTEEVKETVEKKAEETAASLFSGQGDDANMPKTFLSADEIPADGYNIVDLMVRCKLCASKSEARRLVQQGGVTVNGGKAEDLNMVLTTEQLRDGVVIRKGKKVFHKVLVG